MPLGQGNGICGTMKDAGRDLFTLPSEIRAILIQQSHPPASPPYTSQAYEPPSLHYFVIET